MDLESTLKLSLEEKFTQYNLHNSIQVYYIFTLHFKYIKFESHSHLLLFSRTLFMAKVMDIFSKYSHSNVFSSTQKYLFKQSDHNIIVIFCEIVLNKFQSQLKGNIRIQLLCSNLFFNNQFWIVMKKKYIISLKQM